MRLGYLFNELYYFLGTFLKAAYAVRKRYHYLQGGTGFRVLNALVFNKFVKNVYVFLSRFAGPGGLARFAFHLTILVVIFVTKV